MDDEKEPIKSFEDLDVFQRAYALSLAVHRASLAFPRVERFGLAEQVRRASKSICANLGVREAARLKRGVQKVSADGDRIQRRDASVHPLLQRPRIHRRSRRRGVVRRLQGSRQDVSGSIETGNSKELFRLLASGFWLLLLANGERVTAYLFYNGSAS